MQKLYKRIAGVLHYHEAWTADRKIVEHWGIAGERGQTAEHDIPKGQRSEKALKDVLRPAIEKEFTPIPEDDWAILLIEYQVDGFGTEADLEKRHTLEERMNETLGWTGLGNCDGGSIGSNTMEVCCFVADFEVAKRVIEADLEGTPFGDFTRIYREDDDDA